MFTFKERTTQFSHLIVLYTKNIPKILQLFIKFTHSFVAIELLTFCKNAKKRFYCSRELSVFWLNKLYSLSRKGSIKEDILNIHQNQFIFLFLFLRVFIGRYNQNIFLDRSLKNLIFWVCWVFSIMLIYHIFVL